MGELVKQEQYEQEVGVFNHRFEPGLQAMRGWLVGRQAAINKEWPNLIGEDLTRLQGEARSVAKHLALLEHGPKIKQSVVNSI